MKKLIIVLSLTFSLAAMQAQVIIRKNQIELKKNDGTGHYVHINTTNEDVVMSVKKTNKSIKIALQRNSIAKNYSFYFGEFTRKDVYYLAYGENGTNKAILTIDGKKHEMLLIVSEDYAYVLKLTPDEEKKFLKYVNRV